MHEVKLLWIEEETSRELHVRRSYLESLLLYDICIAGTASEAEEYLLKSNYHVIILDIRIPPGNKTSWIKLSNNNQRLGLNLLSMVFEKRPTLLKNLGVFTNETWFNLSEYFKEYNLPERHFLQKSNARSNEHFKKFIDSFVSK